LGFCHAQPSTSRRFITGNIIQPSALDIKQIKAGTANIAVPAVIALLIQCRIPDIVVVSVNVFAAVRIDFRRAHSTNVDNTAITTKTGSAMFAEPGCLGQTNLVWC